MLPGCSESPFSLEKEDLMIRTGNQAVQITNRAAEPLYFHVVALPASPLYDWWPCRNPEHCIGIGPGEVAEVPYSEINEYESNAREASLTWWFIGSVEAGYQVTRMQSQTIPL
jgi:hypothetical protein